MREMRLKKREIQDKSILMEIIEACDVVRTYRLGGNVHRSCELRL